MPNTLTIICPYHEEEETLTLPDVYSAGFSGEVPCGGEKVDKARLHLALVVGKVKEVKVVQAPPVRS